MAEAAEQHEEKPTERAEEELEGPEIRRLRRAIRRPSDPVPQVVLWQRVVGDTKFASCETSGTMIASL